MAGRLFERSEIEKLLREGRVGPLEGFRSKMGRPFTASVKLGVEFKPEFEFENSEPGGAITIDFIPIPNFNRPKLSGLEIIPQ